MGQSSVSNFHNAGNERIVGNNVKPSDNNSGTGNYGNSKYNFPSSNLSKHYGQSSSSIKLNPSLSHQINRHSAQTLDCVDELALLVDELAQLVDELALLVDEPELL
jgi:hypothetical protein